MDLSEKERALLAEAADAPSNGSLRQVLVDSLLERNHPLGELIRLEDAGRALERRRQLERSLRDTLRAGLVPWAKELELTSGLPAWALATISTDPFIDDSDWPLVELALTGSVRDAVPRFRTQALRRLRRLDLSGTRPPAGGLPVPFEPPPHLELLDTVALPAGEISAGWVPFLERAWSAARTVSVTIGPSGELPDWVLALPRLSRVRLVPGREPGDGSVVEAALEWADRDHRRSLEWLGETLTPSELRRALRPALPGERVSLPEDNPLHVELDRESLGSRLFVVRGTGAALFRAEDAPAVDLFASPRHRRLVSPLRLWRVRRALFVELDSPGRPIPLEAMPPQTATRLALELLEALEVWWGTGAPDVISGEWVGLGRDQLRLRESGSLAVIPSLTRRLWPDTHALPDLAGLPLAWGRTSTMAARLTGAMLFEWLTGVAFLDSTSGSAFAVHRRLQHRLARPPRPSEVRLALAPFDDVVEAAVAGALTPAELRVRLSAHESEAAHAP